MVTLLNPATIGEVIGTLVLLYLIYLFVTGRRDAKKKRILANYTKPLPEGLRFAAEPRRWLPFFIIDTVVAGAALVYMIANITAFKAAISPVADGFTAAATVLGTFTVLAVLFAFWFLVRMLISAAIIHQSVKPKELDRSYDLAKKRYLPFLGVVILTALITGILGMVPIIGWLLSVIAGLAFFFAMPSVVVGNKAFDEAMRESYGIFRRKPVEVLVCYLIIAAISLAVVFVFSIPIMGTLFSALAPTLASPVTSFGSILSAFASNSYILIPAGLVFLVGVAISTTFGLYVQTHYYQQLRKKGILGR